MPTLLMIFFNEKLLIHDFNPNFQNKMMIIYPKFKCFLG